MLGFSRWSPSSRRWPAQAVSKDSSLICRGCWSVGRSPLSAVLFVEVGIVCPLVDSSGRRHSLHVWRLPFLPDDWTPEQALAVVELLDDLRERIRAQYEIGLHEVLREQRTAFPATDPANPDSTDPPF